MITYPLNGITYDADDVASYMCTRTSGVYSKDSNFVVTVSGTREVTVSAGLAWINYDDFKGVSVCSKEETVLTVPAADASLPRIDRVVLQFDADNNLTAAKLKTGTPASAPAAPAIVQTHRIYELGLCTISVPAASTAITAASITDTRLDESVCGIMSDGVTKIPTDSLVEKADELLADTQTQAQAMLDQLAAEIASGSFYTKEETDAALDSKSDVDHTHLYAASEEAGGTASSVNGFTISAQTTDPGAGTTLATGSILLVYTA